MQQTTARRARILTILLCALAIISIVSVFLITRYPLQEKEPIADIYQSGKLIESIPLSQVQASYTITVHANDNGSNVIEVRPGSIGIVSADCPDQICVRQGFIHNSLLPITCLPHRLVIQIRKENETWD